MQKAGEGKKGSSKEGIQESMTIRKVEKQKIRKGGRKGGRRESLQNSNKGAGKLGKIGNQEIRKLGKLKSIKKVLKSKLEKY